MADLGVFRGSEGHADTADQPFPSVGILVQLDISSTSVCLEVGCEYLRVVGATLYNGAGKDLIERDSCRVDALGLDGIFLIELRSHLGVPALFRFIGPGKQVHDLQRVLFRALGHRGRSLNSRVSRGAIHGGAGQVCTAGDGQIDQPVIGECDSFGPQTGTVEPEELRFLKRGIRALPQI